MVDRQEFASPFGGAPERQRERSRRVAATLGFVTKDGIFYPPGYEPDSTREWRPDGPRDKKRPRIVGPFISATEVEIFHEEIGTDRGN